MKIMKGIVAGLFFCLLSAPAFSQTAAEVFVSMPDSQMPLLDNDARLDLIELSMGGQDAVARNRFGDSCHLDTLTNEGLQVKIGEQTTLEIVLLPMINDSKIVCLIQTTSAPVSDSEIRFFTTDWKPLDSRMLFTPAPVDWFFSQEAKADPSFKNIITVLDFPLMQYHYDLKKSVLLQTYTSPDNLGEEDKKKIEPLLKNEPRVFQWKLTRFE